MNINTNIEEVLQAYRELHEQLQQDWAKHRKQNPEYAQRMDEYRRLQELIRRSAKAAGVYHLISADTSFRVSVGYETRVSPPQHIMIINGDISHEQEGA